MPPPPPRWIMMNFPRRSSDVIRRPASRRAVSSGSPRSTRTWRNSALRITRPRKCGMRLRATVSTSGSSGIRIHQNIVTFNPHADRADPRIRIEIVLTGLAAELPRVPWTHNVLPVHRTLPQGAPLMGTDAFDRPNPAREIAQSDRVSIDQNFRNAVRREFGHRIHLHESHIHYGTTPSRPPSPHAMTATRLRRGTPLVVFRGDGCYTRE